MMKNHMLSLLASLTCLTAVSSFAIRVGDPVPSLTISKWLKGTPVDVKDGKNIYVVEFWSSASEPCRAAIPQLTQMQKKFKDQGLVVVAVSSDESPEKLKEFLDKQGDKLDYRVAMDDARATLRAYFKAFRQLVYPMAFIVGKDGRLLGFGHPLQGMEKALEEILAGKYDLQTAIKIDAVRAEVDEYWDLARQDDDKARAKAKELGQKLLESRGNDPLKLCELAYVIATDTGNEKRDFALAEAAVDKAEKVAGAKTSRIVMVRGLVRFEAGKQEEGLTLVKQAVELAKDPREKAFVQDYLKRMEKRQVDQAKKK
jgi:thiol-disulfide isomerase/thioredoxin